jgi:cytochrome c oxidase subunit IV
MEHHSMSEVTFHHHESDADFKKKVRKTTILLSVITIIELAIGLGIYNIHKGEHPNELLINMFKGAVCILTLAKAYYIVSVFMHLGDEIRNMIMTIVVPLMLFLWFIGAFLWDGGSYRNLRNNYDAYHKEQSTKKVEKKEQEAGHGGHDAVKPGEQR